MPGCGGRKSNGCMRSASRLLTTENLVSLLNQLPKIVADTFSLSGAALYVADRATAVPLGARDGV